MKEKEALESSLAAINNSDHDTNQGNVSNSDCFFNINFFKSFMLDSYALDASIAKLTLSVSTLVAEKSRMEEAYQNDKRIAREEVKTLVFHCI